MNTFIVQLNFTRWGVETIKDSHKRSQIMSAALDKFGARIKDFYLTMGDCDFVVIFEAPDDKTMAKILLEIGRLGAVTTKTMRAFTKEEFGEIVAELPEKGVFDDLKPRS
ncbi:MAG: GYD domain-containing protein [Proteobacteria bacterium]|nr:GYD domain-containing protein [Pseudomonadota bacterium]